MIPSVYSLQYSDTNSSSCYLITSGWVESALTKVHIPILYLPWWDASDLFIDVDICLTTNIIFRITNQSQYRNNALSKPIMEWISYSQITNCEKIAEGRLHTIHENNFIHRDSHSRNILLETEPFEKWKIVDLGLSQPASKRPQVTDDTPVCYANLMKRCWNCDPSERPSTKENFETTYAWTFSQDCENFNQAEVKRLKSIELKKLGPEYTS
ncbi:hypothetical protein C1646_755379 [Rhizophagus diaphanus]|nr:hypothetical protein C1646_755379 [Rhizophagus diaphanus] [Rhizophagus sp. MUCL 43196]